MVLERWHSTAEDPEAMSPARKSLVARDLEVVTATTLGLALSPTRALALAVARALDRESAASSRRPLARVPVV